MVAWDEAKRKANLRKHGFDFADAEAVFVGRTVTFEDDRRAYGEQRFVTLGCYAKMSSPWFIRSTTTRST
jgi:uncharacterized DUF497 family protein